MNMAGKGPETLVTLTTDFGKVLDGMHRTKIRGQTHLGTAIQIAGVSFILSLPMRLPSLFPYCCTSPFSPKCTLAMKLINPFPNQLALKHRQNKSQRQRIIVFTCSPIAEDTKDLIKLAKKMKKNNINIDFVAFGDLDPTTIFKLEAFNENIRGAGGSSSSGEGGSHLEIVHPGPSLLSDHLLSTPILAGEGGGGGAGGGAGGRNGVGADGGAGDGAGGAGDGTGMDLGVDPSTDPELALALRMSLEEEKARQEREKKAAAPAASAAEGQKLEGIPEEAGTGAGPSSSGEKGPEEEKEPLLGKGEAEGGGSGDAETKDGEGKKDGDDKMDTT